MSGDTTGVYRQDLNPASTLSTVLQSASVVSFCVGPGFMVKKIEVQRDGFPNPYLIKRDSYSFCVHGLKSRS